MVTCPYFMSHHNGPSKCIRMPTFLPQILKWSIVLISISLVFDYLCLYSSLKGKQDREEKAEPNKAHLWRSLRLCGKTYRITSCYLVCVCIVTVLAPPELLIITLFIPIIYTSCIVNSITNLLYSNAHSYRSLVFIFHFLAVCRVL